jgi:hypothetical protein
MTSDEKTLLPSLLNLIRSDLFTFKNITSSVTLIANEDDILGNLSGWGAVISMMPLEFFDIINSMEDMVTIEKFDKKYIRNPKMCAYERYGTTNMWRPLMILNKCPTIMNFDFEYIRYYNIERLSSIISVLISRVQSE